MDSLDLFFKKYAYKFPKGYPDLNDEQDINILADLLENVGVDLTQLNEESSDYEKVIQNKLKSRPQPQGDYKLGTNVNLSGEDARIFKELYPLSPPKKGQEDSSAGSKGSGNGEISMYWLLSKNYTVKDGRGGGAPDLYVNNIGLEVKAYGTKKITLGKFSSDKESLALLNTLFGLNALVATLEKSEKPSKEASSLNFSRGDIIKAFSNLRDFSSNQELRLLSEKYGLIKNIYDKVDTLTSALNISGDFNTEEASAIMIKKIIATKITTKPGDGGYMVDVTENGDIKYTQITQNKLTQADAKTVLDNVAINQAQIIINPEAIFG
jgi:hypothetical protein